MMRSRVPDAAQRLISAFTRVFDTLWAAHRGGQTQNRENNPMQSRMGPGSQRSCGLRPGHEKKNGPSSRPQPNLILALANARPQHPALARGITNTKSGMTFLRIVIPLYLFV